MKWLRSLSVWRYSSWQVLLVTLTANLTTLKLGFGLAFSSPNKHSASLPLPL